MLIPHLLSALLAISSTDSTEIDTSGSGRLIAQEAALAWQTGEISLPAAKAEFHLPPGYRFLNARDAKIVLVDFWGNPPSAAEDALGMIFAPGQSPLVDTGWAVVVSYDDQGHMDDKDAASTDYTALLSEMKKGMEEANEDRVKDGGNALHLVGWAEHPTYDQPNHTLYWAKEINGGGTNNSLNYDVRILGREGILSLNAISPMPQFASVKAGMKAMFPTAKFVSGQAYGDFKSGDKVSTLGIAALVTGGAVVAAKAGLFKGLLLGLLALKKFLVIGAIALFGVIKALFFGKKKEEPRFGDDLSDTKKTDL